MGHRWLVDTEEKADFFKKFVYDQLHNGHTMLYTIKDPTRSDRQNNALHLWFRHIAEELNDAGEWIAHPWKPELEIPFTEVSVKELLFLPVIHKMHNKRKTSALTKSELSESAEALIRYLAEKKGIFCPLPQQSKDEFK